MMPAVAVSESVSEDPPKLILIHVDGFSAEHFRSEAELGNLPNLVRYFGGSGTIGNTVTYFPSKTPTVISSVRDGVHPDAIELLGWVHADQGNGNTRGMVPTFLQMAFSTSRMVTTNLIYGIPFFEALAGLAIQNVPYYLKDYHVLQFYWYKADTHAHFYGEEEYRIQLREFDRQIGKLMKKISDDVNVVIYSDHGMTFGEGVPLDEDIDRIVGHHLNIYSYPTLFLTNPETAEYYSRRLVRESDIDLTFYRQSDDHVTGIHQNGLIHFTGRDETVSYHYEGEDYLGYYSTGYNGEYLDKDEWLALTYDTEYPMAPINIFFFMQNPNAPEVLTLLGKGRYNQTGYSSAGNHGGFNRADMLVPLFVRGPNTGALQGREYCWLPEIFNILDDFDFESKPPRDRHYVSTRYHMFSPGFITEMGFSPTYRLYYGATLYADTDIRFESIDVWGRADLFRSYLSRLWVGTGIEISSDSEINPFATLQYDLHLRRFVIQNSFQTNRKFKSRISFEITPEFAIETVNFRTLGVRIDF